MIASQSSWYDMTAEFHGHMKDIYTAVWASGSGQMGSDVRSTMQTTFDVAVKGNSARFKTQIRVLPEAAYLLIQGITGTMQNTALQGTLSLAAKQWMKMPTSEDIPTPWGDAISNAESVAEIANMLRIDSQRTDAAGNTVYTMTLSRAAAKEIMRALRQASQEFGIADTGSPTMSVIVHLTVGRDGGMIAADANITMDGGDVGGSGHFRITRRSSPVTVTAPANALDMDAFFAAVTDGFSTGLREDHTTEVWPEEFNGDSSSTGEDWSTSDDWSDWGTVPESKTCTITQIRAGECIASRSHRSSSSSSEAATLP
jgi:hypothetical protein